MKVLGVTVCSSLLIAFAREKPIEPTPRSLAGMNEHLMTLQTLVAAVAADDAEAVVRAAQSLAEPSHEALVLNHIGATVPPAQPFPTTRLLDAAHRRDRHRVAAQLVETSEVCARCHAPWKPALMRAQPIGLEAR
ncbi:MAG: hypothetical protein GQE15_37470 [Archangiaceae bacterium]|nr:hypothetical protein [Archangiaceae bacterium]